MVRNVPTTVIYKGTFVLNQSLFLKRRNRLNTEPSPWLEGCAPKCNNENTPFIEGRALNYPEHPRSLWYQNKEGRWFNDDVCTEGEDGAEVGRAEPSEEKGNRK